MKKPSDAGSLFKRFLADAPGDHPLRAEAERYVSAAVANGPSPAPPAAPHSGPTAPTPDKK
jgi:hypothetical protein